MSLSSTVFQGGMYPGLPQSMLERVTGGIRQIDSDHGYIHDGLLYHVFLNVEISAGGVHDITIKTPPQAQGVYVHYRNEHVSTSADKLKVDLYEGATLAATPGGSALSIINHNRLSASTSKCTALSGPSVVSAGDLISQSYIGGGTGQGQSRSGAETSAANEFILKHDTVYLVRMTNGSSGANVVQIRPFWYEEGSA